MISISKAWNPKQKLLLELLKKDSTFEEAVSVCMDLHKQVHDLEVENDSKTIYQQLLQMLTPDNVKYRPKDNFSSIAWNIWHITRIEDAIANIIPKLSDFSCSCKKCSQFAVFMKHELSSSDF